MFKWFPLPPAGRFLLFKWRGLIMALVALSILVWAQPTSYSWWGGFILACLGESLRIWALGWTGEHTRGQELKAPRLVTDGPYALVRNPLYAGNILTASGVLLASCGGLELGLRWGLILWGAWATTLVYASCIDCEERFLEERFGDEFRAYRQSTPALVPHYKTLLACLGRGAGSESHFNWRDLRFEFSSWGWFIGVWGYLAWRALGGA